jgi:hypothetical protein
MFWIPSHVWVKLDMRQFYFRSRGSPCNLDYLILSAYKPPQNSTISRNFSFLTNEVPITAAARSKAWTVFARSDAGIVDSNSTQGIDICVCVYSVFVLSCVCSYRPCDGLISRPRSPTACVKKITELKKRSIIDEFLWIYEIIFKNVKNSNHVIWTCRMKHFWLYFLLLFALNCNYSHIKSNFQKSRLQIT